VRNDTLRKLGNQIEGDAMSVIHGEKQKFLYGFLGIIEENGPPNGITSSRRQNANTKPKEIL
jgi:hypothetical protein